MQIAVDLVAEALTQDQQIYGVNTGFGGMVGEAVRPEDASKAQTNLLSFLATSSGDWLDQRHVRTAMILRAHVLAQGCSGVRFEIVNRLLRFLEANALPRVREHGSIGASGDLVPLSAIARAITGHPHVEVKWQGEACESSFVLNELGFTPLELLPKEGLAIVNGTSFSSAIAAHAVYETRHLFACTLAVQAIFLNALDAHQDPFSDFVHQKKPHPGQVWVAETMRSLFGRPAQNRNGDSLPVQDRYSVRCLPQYLGPLADSLQRVRSVVETEMNAVSDNPLVDPDTGRFYQSGNFLGQGLSLAMDDLRRDIGLLAKHLDVQIATLVSPEFSGDLPASLRGNSELPYNMGMKGLQITGNSLMPLLSWYGNPIVAHFPTHAEQFNQNVNGLSWESANLGWKSVAIFRRYLSVATLFAIQAIDLRAHKTLNHFDGRALLSPQLQRFYEVVMETLDGQSTKESPFLFNDGDRWLEQDLAKIEQSLESAGELWQVLLPIVNSFDQQSS